MTRYLFLLLLTCLLAGGCASTQELSNDPSDPWEGVNRRVYSFNDALDRAFLVPAATGYRAVAPEFVEDGVHNFFSNLGDVGVAFNNTLQFKFLDAASDIGRIIVNSTIGLLGFMDVASHMGLRKHEEDFGQTLAHWGVPSGPYLVMPVLGPGSVRDSSGWFVDQSFNPMSYIDDEIYWPLRGLNILDTRVSVLKLEQSTGIGVYDDYTQMREIYLQRRKHLISNGNDEANRDEEEELRRELEMLEQ